MIPTKESLLQHQNGFFVGITFTCCEYQMQVDVSPPAPSWRKTQIMTLFESNIVNLYGEKGKQWLNNLPKRVVQIEAAYGLSRLKPVDNLSYNYVLSGFQGSQPIILKLILDIEEWQREAAALKAFSGFGVVEVISENSGLLLLECANPGVSLKSYFPDNEDEAINITAHVMQRLHKAPIPHQHIFPHIKDWLSELDKDWHIPLTYLRKARQLRDQLLQTAGPDVFLHGDLHHDNILQNGDDWVVIDPKGVMGEASYEVAAFIRNPIPELLSHDKAQDIIRRRVIRFAEIFEWDEGRIMGWCFVQAVLAWIWTLN